MNRKQVARELMKLAKALAAAGDEEHPVHRLKGKKFSFGMTLNVKGTISSTDDYQGTPSVEVRYDVDDLKKQATAAAVDWAESMVPRGTYKVKLGGDFTSVSFPSSFDYEGK